MSPTALSVIRYDGAAKAFFDLTTYANSRL